MSRRDDVLRHALKAHQGGEPLSWALRAALFDSLQQAVAGCRATPTEAATLALLREHLATSRFAPTCDRALLALFDPRLQPDNTSDSSLSRLVSRCVTSGETPAVVVRAAMRLREEQRAVEHLARDWPLRADALHDPRPVAPVVERIDRESSAASQVLQLTLRLRASTSHVRDYRKWARPLTWQTPAETLCAGSGEVEDLALLLWSAATALAVGSARLGVGVLGGDGHIWLELSDAGLDVDPLTCRIQPIGRRPHRVLAHLHPHHCEFIAV